MRKFIATILALSALIPAIAQNSRKVSGVVRDENADILPGAIVVVKKGAADGPVAATATTDNNGRYTIECTEKDYISVHFLGYAESVFPAKGKATLDVNMVPDASQRLEDVVVIGYGAVKQADLTGSVTSVKMAEIRDEPVLSIDQALQGRVAGMEVTSTDGEPGSDAVIRIRGSRSITASNDPLIVVDGVMDAVSSLSDINPNDIEAISVLKDASSTAIYGARGANGVIIITTKGSEDSNAAMQNISISFKATGGVSQLPRNLDLMNSEEFGIYRNEYFQHAGVSGNMNNYTPLSNLSVKTPYTNGPGTNWIEDVSRIAPYQSYSISMNGFQGKQKFYAALSYNNEQGIIKKSGKENYTGTLNITNKVFNWLSLYANLRYQYRQQDNFLTSIGAGGIYYAAQYLSPLINPQDSYNPMSNSITTQANAVVRLEQNTDRTDRSMLNIGFGGTVTPVKSVKYKTKFSYYLFDRQRYKYTPSTLPSRTDEMGGYAQRQNYGEQSLYFENTLEFSKENKRHHIDATLGHTFKHFISHNFTTSGEGYIVDDMRWKNMSAVSNKESYSVGTDETIKNKMAIFGRVNYNFKRRYYLTLTGRFDGASNFAANHKWGFFPSGAFKWAIYKEPWLKKAEWLDDLSLKISLGQSGNDLNQAYRSLARLDGGSGGYVFNGSYSQEYWQARIASPNLTWETTTLGNIALDAAFFNNKLSFTFEAYKAITTDLLLTVKTPHHTGYDTKYENIGRTTTQGVELSVESRNVVKRNFTWSTAFTISHASSIVNNIGAESEVSSRNSPTGGYMTVGYRVGYPVNSFWGFQYAGVWHNQEEIDRNKITHTYANDAASTKLGYPIYIDQDHDGTLNSKDIVFLGSPDPVVSGGLQNTFRIKNLSLGVFFSYCLGGKVLNYSEFYMAGSRRTNQYAYMVNAWHPIKNPESNLPRAGIFDSNAVPSSFLIHDASYLRLKTVSLGYRFNIKSRAIRELELSCSGENLYVWTNYNGFDPDVSSGGTNGYDNSYYPKPRRIVFTISMKY
ncbi:MAG: TonB-dependent receptor [Bacteroidales bacterium]|nr:TonB-dependent receptor [Bacteroidales bacterium]